MGNRARASGLTAVVGTLLAWAVSASAGEVTAHGFVLARGVMVDGPPSWMTGGFGRFTESGAFADRTGALASHARGEAQAALDWSPSVRWRIHGHGLARGEPNGTRGRPAGLVEAFLEFRPELSPHTALAFRLGIGFPPVSLENVDPLWTSPYTLTLSAIDTWIAEEVRPAALEATLVRKGTGEGRLRITAGVLAGADTAGALLAWRGWTIGDRLVTVGETLPLPPLASLRPGGGFERQRDGTTPTAELDGRPGWLAQVHWSQGRTAVIRAWALDNRGDRRLHRGQYAWRTRLVSMGASVAPLPHLTVVADAMWGQTGMGPSDDAHVDVAFKTGYLLASLGGRHGRFSVRYDRFQNTDRDHTAEDEGEVGHAWTVDALAAPRPWLRLALEGVRLKGSRPAATPTSSDDRRFQLEVRLLR